MHWPDAPVTYAEILNWAVEIGERSAAHAGAVEDWAPPAGALACAVSVCDAVNNANNNRTRAVKVINAMIRTIEAFKGLPENILAPHTGQLFESLFRHIRSALANHVASSQETYVAAVPVVVSVIRQDFDRVAFIAATQNRSDDTLVSQDVFGPMWPLKMPSRWPITKVQENNRLPNYSVRSIVQNIAHAAVS